jgi:flagellar biosynthesis protein FliR
VTLDSGLLYAFLLVFVRASAMMLSSPIFGAQHTPLNIRILTTLSVAAALTMTIKSHIGPVPQDLFSMLGAVANEAVAGLVLGTVVSMVFFAVQMAGSFLDFQIGLGSSQILNPITGVPVTVVAQFKFMLAIVIFLCMNGHHAMFKAFLHSYDAFPMLSMGSLAALQNHIIPLFGEMSLLALQIAAPVAAVGMIIDASLGMIGKAAPQMQVMLVGMPAKILLGFIALSATLPALVSGVDAGVQNSLDRMWSIWREAD